MKAQVVLSPTESKKLIAKAIVKMPDVQIAEQSGLVVLHPSSSTYFIFEELTGNKPKTEVWLCGMIAKKGLCLEWGSYSHSIKTPGGYLAQPGQFPHSWIIKGKRLQPIRILDEICKDLGPNDVYIKGGNALDLNGRVGVLIASMAEGTIGRVIAASKKRGFKIICPIGLEKGIPISIEEASKKTGSNKDFVYSMGLPCSLMPVPGRAVTEVDAFRVLADVQALPISAGGVSGAEGSIVFLITGEQEDVLKAIEETEKVKGAQIPEVKSPDCLDCLVPACKMAGKKKPWC